MADKKKFAKKILQDILIQIKEQIEAAVKDPNRAKFGSLEGDQFSSSESK